MKTFKNVEIFGWTGVAIGIIRDGKREDATLLDHLNLILANAPFQTQQDCKEGRRLGEALEKVKDKDVIEIEESTHDWLKKIAEQITPPLYRTNGNIIYEHIKEGFEKLYQPGDKE